jgi:hypothetical protein
MGTPVVSVVERILQDVAELPDRTSPDGWPEAMLVTAGELAVILHDRLPALLGEPENVGRDAMSSAGVPDASEAIKAGDGRTPGVSDRLVGTSPPNSRPAACLNAPLSSDLASLVAKVAKETSSVPSIILFGKPYKVIPTELADELVVAVTPTSDVLRTGQWNPATGAPSMEPYCLAEHPDGMRCHLAKGHTGEHVALVSREMLWFS